MIKYSKKYIEKYYEHFRFFRPECMDKRIREVMMRGRHCFDCPGITRCKMHPEYWLVGEEERKAENEKLMKEFPEQVELPLLPGDLEGRTGEISITKGMPAREKRLGV
ncbi:MAG: hypothetical protein ACLFQV_00315 [Vulcanimicrobiota bacterium]